MAGLNSHGFDVLEGVPHIEQSLSKIITTFVGERTLREWIGNPGTRLLGENMTQANMLRFFSILWALVELYEPRFKIQKFQVNDLTRAGLGDFTIIGQYRPYAHLEWEQAHAIISVDNNTVSIRQV